MPDLSNKVLKLTSGRYFFVPFVTLLTSNLHFMLSKSTLDMTTFVTGGGTFKAVDIIAKYPEVHMAEVEKKIECSFVIGRRRFLYDIYRTLYSSRILISVPP